MEGLLIIWLALLIYSLGDAIQGKYTMLMVFGIYTVFIIGKMVMDYKFTWRGIDKKYLKK